MTGGEIHGSAEARYAHTFAAHGGDVSDSRMRVYGKDEFIIERTKQRDVTLTPEKCGRPNCAAADEYIDFAGEKGGHGDRRRTDAHQFDIDAVFFEQAGVAGNPQ